ncbi:hypothetical protein CYMTET_37218 [Cymbomonas tetramitiformis]|uniref:Uncharacterized protein n=1 Tax=Cymbomonas tetramitiformis TaxID=36881 RepID=A0AAE0CFP8_9CHLO|nr:hypothetical protein CYMTET_37218 [Cymbomonas tetramitiformis]
MRAWVAGLERAVRDVSALLETLTRVGHDVEPDPPPTRDIDSRQCGGGGVRFPPSKWRDERSCKPDGKFRERNRRFGAMDDVVSAFQTAFDSGDDAAFAGLCQQHDQPLVRDDSEPFTYPKTLDMGLRAQYAGMAHGGSSGVDISDAIAEARGALSALRSAASTAAGAGGATAPLQSSLNLGRIALPPVVCVVLPPAQHDVPEAPLYPVSASDLARFESPFESTFMDRCFGQLTPTLNACSVIRPLAVCDTELSVIDDVSSDSDCGSDDDSSYEPVVVRCVRPVGAASLPKGLSFASLVLPLLMLVACAPELLRVRWCWGHPPTWMLRLTPGGCLPRAFAIWLTVFSLGFLLVFWGCTVFWTLDFNLQFLDFRNSSTNLALVSGSGYLWSLDSGSG